MPSYDVAIANSGNSFSHAAPSKEAYTTEKDVPWLGLGEAVTSRVTGSWERYATAPADAQQPAARTTSSSAVTMPWRAIPARG